MMNREEIMQKVNDIFKDVFDDDELVINENTTPEDIEDWDSLEQINIIMAIGEEFGIKFDLEEVSKLDTVKEILVAIEEKVGN